MSEKIKAYIKTHCKILTALGIYSAMALAVMLPLLLPGYILTLDLVFTPHLPWPQEVTNSFLLEAVLWVFNQMLPGDVLEKIVLIAILILSGMGAYKLMIYCKIASIPAAYWQFAAYFAGVFYMINPFSYARFMAGQWMVLLGYAVLPFFVVALLRLLQKPSWRTAWPLALWMTVVSIVSLHHTGMLLLMTVVGLIATGWQYRNHARKFLPILKWAGAAVGLFLVASSYWLIATVSGQNNIGRATQSFDAAHFEGFATHSGALGPLGEVIRLQGFWAEGEQLFRLPNDALPAWGLLNVIVWALVIIGIKYAWMSQRRATLLLGVSGIISIIIAATPLIQWLSQVVPFIGGYREPQKFITILALAYSFFAGAAVAVLAYHWRNRARYWRYATAGFLILPVILTPTMFWGFAGQLTPRHYPADWYSMNDYLNTEVDNGKILFLPWQQYLSFSFTERTIANPADKFFEKPIIESDNLNFKDVPPTIPDEEKQHIAEALQDKANIISQLKKLNIRYILLSTDSSDDSFSYLAEVDNLKTIRKGETLTLFEINK